ncbi:glycosyltransferase [Desulfoferrobacter suflitae]|uniref:glycosyltransferase n=1 Tax=Desulfoferrobacter suflitae TaxID=2865782 RepID=UPI002164C9E3|nr:glycosyltransferase [Desulfoferrobacter suflitae]MCK8601615.1 glycosyltransferase [Desulfoferrobacter suflitae]
MTLPSLFDYRDVVGKNVVEELTILASYVGNRSIKMVNSTAVGGGVAEMLHRVVPLLNELGIQTTWEVIKGEPDFFDITKSFHNALQGKQEHFSKETLDTYLHYNELNNKDMTFDEDLIVIHDPQPAALIHWNPKRKNKWVWRCHIDLSHPNQQLWRFLQTYIEQYDAAIFSSPLFSPELAIPQYQFYPTIDPLADKNKELDTDYIDQVLEKYGIPRDKPLVTQISRYDPWKDPVGVIQAYQLARKYVDCRLLLVGDKAADDPEAEKILQTVKETAGNDPDIHIIYLTKSIASEINAFQRASDVVLQKSLREGFALTVSEALWKRRPVIGSAVGGIPAQIIHGYTGVLVHSVEGASLQIRGLLNQPDFAAKLGENGHQRVKDEFLITQNLKRYLLLLLAVERPDESSILLE